MIPLLLAVGLMTLAALAAVLWPVLRPRRPVTDTSPDLAIYRDQLSEVERDLERGLIRPEEAAAARLEVERRLLRAAGASGRTAMAESGGRGRLAVLIAAVLVPVLTLGLYLRLGAPGMPDRPLAARQQELARNQTPQIQAMVAQLEARLKENPKDLEGWLMLGRSRGVLDNVPGAVDAYRKAQALAPDDPRVLAGLGEALVAAGGGVVTPEATQLFTQAQQAGGDDPRAAYYLGLAAAQGGDNHRALETWRRLLAATPADAPWRPRVEEAIRTAARDLGLDPATVLAQVPKAPDPSGPNAADVAAVEKMTPQQQQEFIRSMVGRLEARLAADGSDAVGWQRLAQARLLLGERDKAQAAYEHGLALHPDNAALLKGYAGLLLGPPPEGSSLPVVGDEAARLYARAATAAPDDPEAQWYLGIRALQEGHKDEARDHWRRVLARLEPNHPDYATVKERLDSLGG